MPPNEHSALRVMGRSGVLILGVLCLAACSDGGSDGQGREVASGAADGGEQPASDPPAEAEGGVQGGLPLYTEDGDLVAPDEWPEWVFVGSALNLNYSETPYPADVLSAVYMEPGSYRHFKEHGTFREGTQTVLVAYVAASGAAPARDGVYPSERVAFEMSVKDGEQHPEGWGYYTFSGDDAGVLLPPDACFSCHDEHAETDHVFTQFYPLLP